MFLCEDILWRNSKRHVFLGSGGGQGNKPKQAMTKSYRAGTQRQENLKEALSPGIRKKLGRKLQAFKGMELVRILVNGTNHYLNVNDLKDVLKLTKDQKNFILLQNCFF